MEDDSDDDDDDENNNDPPKAKQISSSSSSQQNETEIPARLKEVMDNTDKNTVRIMISTDNHLGYNERDPVRGMDSFAAFEEVLFLSKQFHCDMVLIAGDLFHDNRPSRRTIHKTMEIIRRYCMGPDPVQIQILSDQKQNFRNPCTNVVNYQDPYYSIDLPIFSIHGNHDDPSRDAGGELLAALDLLSISNLVNYWGRQDQVDKVEISPILIQKGTTKVALYGLGSMRDERLNRMWDSKKVRFLRPAEEEDDNDGDNNKNGNDDDDDDETTGFFNIFALHQNRDLGRGSKNCIQESMIPEWMDLVVWVSHLEEKYFLIWNKVSINLIMSSSKLLYFFVVVILKNSFSFVITLDHV
jgi:double-strand break repair protein MRE11